MDILSFLAEQQPIITESFLKWVTTGMGLAIVALCGYIKLLVAEKVDILQKQLDSENQKRDSIEAPLRERYADVIKKKDVEIVDLKKQIRNLHAEKIEFLSAQIEDAKQQEVGLEQLSLDYNALVESIVPLVEQNVELLEYYRQRRERS